MIISIEDGSFEPKFDDFPGLEELFTEENVKIISEMERRLRELTIRANKEGEFLF